MHLKTTLLHKWVVVYIPFSTNLYLKGAKDHKNKTKHEETKCNFIHLISSFAHNKHLTWLKQSESYSYERGRFTRNHSEY